MGGCVSKQNKSSGEAPPSASPPVAAQQPVAGDTNAQLLAAATSGDVAAVRAALDGGANCNCADEFGKTPLHFAATGGHLEVAQLLLEKGADKEAKSIGGEVTPLFCAAYYGKPECVQLLLERGADKEAKSVDGMTPLHRAACFGNTECVRLLLERGADKEVKDNFNETPLEGCVDKQFDDAATRAAKEATRALLRSSGKSGAAK